MKTATVTQDELDAAKTPAKRLDLLKSKGIPVKGKNLNTDDYLIGMTSTVTYVYEWREIDGKPETPL